jgi:serine/threonine protein kinase
MVGGKLRSSSLDVYISMEYAEGGDLYSMRGQLTEGEVAQLMAQLLESKFPRSHLKDVVALSSWLRTHLK